MSWRKIEHGMLLDGKSVMDDALPDLLSLKELVPEKLHDEFDRILNMFEDSLAGCDESKRYKEIE